ncbi:hypothetical protein Q4602_20665 [Paraglaciecola chathamensis]|uniref:hypothetical protein n=1 Tax=Paraglaciecola chathamensis TaxID=368405 RepID=UPI0027064904|nr:hypothetical protein [Paraglaciecola chathamensis]MDO6841902.1 hypothetical protein [Paraglaciecola chathamensis]
MKHSSAYRFISVLVMLALMFSSTATVLAASWQVNQAQQYASDDAMLICTGSQIKWISTQAFFDTGDMVFIDPPTDAPAELGQMECPNQFLSDHYTEVLSIVKLDDNTIAYKALVSRLARRPYTAYAYQTAQSRAPPISIM